MELLYLAEGGVDVDVAGDLHCVAGVDRLHDLCSAWWMKDDREGTWGPLVLISPTREPNRERRPLAGGSSFCLQEGGA